MPVGVGHAQLCQRVAASGTTWPRVAPIAGNPNPNGRLNSYPT